MRALLMIAALIFLPPDRPDPTPKAKEKPLQEQLQGEWQLTKALRCGEPEDPMKVERTVFVVKGNLIQIREAGKDKSDDANFTLDTSKSPAFLNIMPIGRGRGGDLSIPGIVKIEGETLTICFVHGGKGERPTEFTSPANTNVALLEFRRVKSK